MREREIGQSSESEKSQSRSDVLKQLHERDGSPSRSQSRRSKDKSKKKEVKSRALIISQEQNASIKIHQAFCDFLFDNQLTSGFTFTKKKRAELIRDQKKYNDLPRINWCPLVPENQDPQTENEKLKEVIEQNKIEFQNILQEQKWRNFALNFAGAVQIEITKEIYLLTIQIFNILKLNEQVKTIIQYAKEVHANHEYKYPFFSMNFSKKAKNKPKPIKIYERFFTNMGQVMKNLLFTNEK